MAGLFKNSIRTSVFAVSVFLFFITACTSTRSSFVETAFDLDMKMIYVEGGQYYMGGTKEQVQYAGDDEIVRQVTLDDFYIGELEITQSQWTKVMGTTLSEQRDLSEYDYEINGVGADCAMYYVSWDEAKEFVRRLRDRTGKNYSLPTEAQWEYAARGGLRASSSIYAGSDDANLVAWFGKNSENCVHQSKTKKPNELGIYDMSGNVYEWCEDYYGEYMHFFGAENEVESRNPRGPKTGFDRVLRGGSYLDESFDCRVSARFYDEPQTNNKLYGFRVALIPSDADNSVPEEEAEKEINSEIYSAAIEGKIVFEEDFESILEVGGEAELSIDFSDSKDHKVFWLSENPLVAIVDDNGKVSACGAGVTRIAAYDRYGSIVDMFNLFVQVPQISETSLDIISSAVQTINNISNNCFSAIFSGNLKNGYPNGTGTLSFAKSRRIDMHDDKGRVASEGDYIIGEWDRGHLVQGRWYDKDNNLKETIILGRANNPELDNSLGLCSK